MIAVVVVVAGVVLGAYGTVLGLSWALTQAADRINN